MDALYRRDERRHSASYHRPSGNCGRSSMAYASPTPSRWRDHHGRHVIHHPVAVLLLVIGMLALGGAGFAFAGSTRTVGSRPPVTHQLAALSGPGAFSAGTRSVASIAGINSASSTDATGGHTGLSVNACDLLLLVCSAPRQSTSNGSGTVVGGGSGQRATACDLLLLVCAAPRPARELSTAPGTAALPHS